MPSNEPMSRSENVAPRSPESPQVEGREWDDARDSARPAKEHPRRRIYVPGRLLTDDTIDEIATEIAAALRRRRQHER
jgi:hypothetical protein